MDQVRRYVTYLRVSTQAQGASGLGLEAQRQACRQVAGDAVIAEFVEIESGAKVDRPQLAAALKRCRATKATLVVARLDRLARNVRFISEILDSGVELVCADLPSVNRLTLHVLAAVAEEERRLISSRTKAALSAARERGTQLGGLRNVNLVSQAKAASAAGARVRSAASQRHAEALREGVAEVRQELGDAPLRTLADALDARGFRSPRGAKLTSATLSRALSAAL